MDTFSIESFVAKANAIGKTLNGDFEQVKRIVDGAELVAAVWQGAAEPNRVGMLIVKGERLLKEIVASGKSRDLRWTAVPCTSYEQAFVLKQFVDKQGLH